MADYLILNNSDSGAGSLRQAMLDANANWISNPGEASTISFAPAVAGQTITLSSALPVIAGDLTIDGAQYDIDGNPSTQNITVNGASLFRVFFVQSGDATFRYFSIANGHATGEAGTDGGGGGLGAGAAIFVAGGNTAITNVNFTNDDATGGAGAVGSSTGGAGGNGPDGTGGGTALGGNGGFGGGGGANFASSAVGGTGGLGGGGGAGDGSGGVGGVGGGQGGTGPTGVGGGGAAFGGAIFVQDGASLIIGQGTFTSDDVTGGTGNTAGAAVGSDLFLMSSSTGTYTFAPLAGQTLTFNGSIADDSVAGLPGGGYTAGSGPGAQIFMTGEGTVVYTAGHTYSNFGATTVSNGILRVNGTVAISAITVSGVGTLDGTGTANQVTVLDGGTIAPGAGGIGTLTTGPLKFVDPGDPLRPAGTVAFELGGTGAGQFDVLQVNGALDLTGATFTGFLTNSYNPAVGNSFIIIQNDGVDSIVGTFAGAPEGGSVNVGGRAFQVSYAGGDGNDVTLTAVANGTPGLTGFGPSAKIVQSGPGATPQILDGNVVFNDVESNFNTGTLTLTGVLAEDTISINQTGFDPGEFFISSNRVLFEGIDIGGISGGSGSNLTITFNGAATSRAIDALIENLTYVDAASTPTASRTLTLTVTDNRPASTGPQDIVVSFNQAPALSGIPATASIPSTPSVLAPGAAVSDADDTTLASATVHISGGTFAGDGDVLSATTTGTSITASYDSGSETLTLLGSDTIAHYKQVLDSVTFQSTSSDPTNSGANTTRTIDWQASDGVASSAVATMTATITPAFNGTPGNDSFTAASGNERIDAGAGIDTITFGFKLVDATVSYVGNTVVVDGPSSHTVLTGFEVFKFTDGTVNNNDSDPLVDDLFYYATYHDVWNAHADADAHYHTIGWHEGRDPDAFFSTAVYLSANPGVKAAGVDPLTHFDQSGWKEGRTPSINFDPAAYLAANPDVKAAHIDPLAHFLQYGAGEGRQPIAPTELLAANGFDFVYYLQHNPDVAAAHIDPFQHFETVGWKEGRNPNALFDTNGYLATYADVKAAGINPLDHYNQYGWHEGRDPSVAFDTTDYLSHYPDVASAHINPLSHFLANGIHEGRSPFADGVWG